jgi:hypothetical protein
MPGTSFREAEDLPDFERTELDYDGVVAALEALVGEWVHVSITDADGAEHVARVAGVLGPASVQDTLEGGVEGVVFIVGDAPRS